ncbi:DNA repair protein RecO [Pannus brasiliensis CCIBt3594]|uniref:DNA repair protein RecO n=1 Tax=Pannus brasiliensis CCIBt3594 TaxID=1427578 RepID=A0AAW9QV26_9CHRO
MSRTYQATGINLKGMAIGEADRLLTILTAERGLVRAIAPGARKFKSKLRGRSEIFVVNHLLIVEGKNLDKVIQADTIESYPKLSRDLGKLAVGQYLAEVVLAIALGDQPQSELYELFLEHLGRIERVSEPRQLLPHLCQALFHLMAIAGFAPQVHHCLLDRRPILPDPDNPNRTIGFSFHAGGTIDLSALRDETSLPKIDSKLNPLEVSLLQGLGESALPATETGVAVELAWINLDRLLRDYTGYHLGKTFRSSTLVEGLSPLEF